MPPVSVSNPRQYLDGILLTAVFSTGEVCDFFATPYDTEEYGRELYQSALLGDFGQVQPYVAPTATPAELLAEIRSAAYKEIQQTDRVLIRCIKNGVEWPGDWQEYYQSCLEIYRLEAWPSAGVAMPTRPEYPEGT